MRETKFRAFTKDRKMVYDVAPFQWDYCITRMAWKCIESNGTGVLGSGGTEAKFEIGGYALFEEKSIMQYTGLEDKNKKEIYDKDIVKCLIDFGPAGEYEVICVVQMTPFGVSPLDKWLWDEGNLPEVIGNIYEHPHLIEQQPSK